MKTLENKGAVIRTNDGPFIAIAEIILTIRWAHYVPEDVGHICEMAQENIKMVMESVDSCVHQDIDRAKTVIDSDDIIDRYFIQVRKVLIKKIVDDPTAGEHILDC